MKINVKLSDQDKLDCAIEINRALFGDLDHDYDEDYPIDESAVIAGSMPDIIVPGYWGLIRVAERSDIDWIWTDLTQYTELSQIPAGNCFSSEESGSWAFIIEISESGEPSSVFHHENWLGSDDGSVITWGPSWEDSM